MVFPLVVFTLFGAMGVVASLGGSIDPSRQWKMMSEAAGVSLVEVAGRTPETTKAMRFISGFGASQMLGMNGFALALLWIPFRAGERWAWCALWFYPLMFAWHFVTYAKRTRMSYVQIVNFTLASAALATSAGRFFE
jgi:hypothetical protein